MRRLFFGCSHCILALGRWRWWCLQRLSSRFGAAAHHPPRPLQQLLALFAQRSPLALLHLPGAAAHAAAVVGHILIGVVFHLAPSAGFAATGAVQISSAARSRTS